MKLNLVKRTVLSMLAMLPWAELLSVVRQQMTREVSPLLLERIDVLVELAERHPPEERALWVRQRLVEDKNLATVLRATRSSVLNWVIETAVQRLRADLAEQRRESFHRAS